MRNASVYLVTSLLVGCAGSASTDLFLMDAPPAGVTSVKVFVAAVQVHVADPDKVKGLKGDPNDTSGDDEPVVKLKSDEPNKWVSLDFDAEIDLMTLQGEVNARKLGTLDLPDGKITQIRLILDTTKSGTVTRDGQADCTLDMSTVAKTGIKINHPFKLIDAVPGDKHEVVLDFDLGESLESSGNCYKLKPVIKIHKVKREGAEVDTKI